MGFSKLTNVNGHTIDTNLLKGGVVLDFGCRDFTFQKSMRDLGCTVVSYDAAKLDGDYINKAVSLVNGKTTFCDMGEGSYISHIKSEMVSSIQNEVEMESIYDILNRYENIDVIKFDIEGSEYEILSDPNFIPKAKQITVEFHEHSMGELHDKYFKKCTNNLLRWYNIVYYCTGNEFKYMDTLFIKR